MLLFLMIINCIIWGIVTNKVISNRGYSNNWFWYGFFFGFIAVIVAFSKPRVSDTQSIDEYPNNSQMIGIGSLGEQDVEQEKEILSIAEEEIDLEIQELEIKKKALELRKQKLRETEFIGKQKQESLVAEQGYIKNP